MGLTAPKPLERKTNGIVTLPFALRARQGNRLTRRTSPDLDPLSVSGRSKLREGQNLESIR